MVLIGLFRFWYCYCHFPTSCGAKLSKFTTRENAFDPDKPFYFDVFHFDNRNICLFTVSIGITGRIQSVLSLGCETVYCFSQVTKLSKKWSSDKDKINMKRSVDAWFPIFPHFTSCHCSLTFIGLRTLKHFNENGGNVFYFCTVKINRTQQYRNSTTNGHREGKKLRNA